MKKQNNYPLLISGAGKLGRSLMTGILTEEYPIMDMVVDYKTQPFYVKKQKFFAISPLEYQRFLDMLMMHREYPLIIDSVPGTVSQNNMKLYAQYPMIPKIIMSSGVKDKSVVKNTLFLENGCLEILAFELFLKETEIDLSGPNYWLEIFESHQASKGKDVSATAKKFIPHFNRWKLAFNNGQIISIRDPAFQLKKLGIPAEFLDGHAYHRYSIFSKDPNETKLKTLFDLAKSYFTNNSLFSSLNCCDFPYMPTNISEKSIDTILWSSGIVVYEIYSLLAFTLSFIEYEDGRKEIRFEHQILGRQPYVNGLVQHAIPFMSGKITNGLSGENFSTIDLYNWASKKLPEI